MQVISSPVILSHLKSSHHRSSYLISRDLITSHLISSHLITSHLITSHLITGQSLIHWQDTGRFALQEDLKKKEKKKLNEPERAKKVGISGSSQER